jgi:hypothetical protein
MLAVWARSITYAMVVCGGPFVSSVALGEEIDSEHLFGFTQGTDIGAKGDKEVELEGFGAFGKGRGAHSGVTGGIEGKIRQFPHRAGRRDSPSQHQRRARSRRPQ